MVLMNLLELQQKLLSDLLCFFFQFFMKTNRHCCSLKPCRNLHWNLNKRITKKYFNCSCMHISHTLRDDTHMTPPPPPPPPSPPPPPHPPPPPPPPSHPWRPLLNEPHSSSPLPLPPLVHVNQWNQNKNKTKSCHIQIDHAFYCLI